MRRVGCLAIIIGTLLLGGLTAVGVAAPQVDIVIILTSGQRWDTLQYMPNVTANLVQRGVLFTNALAASPLASVSLAGLLTGVYPSIHGVLDNDAPDGGTVRFRDSNSLPAWLAQQTSYRLGFAGVYFNQYENYLDTHYIPPGWHDWMALHGPGYFNYTVADNGSLRTYGTAAGDYSTEVLAARAVQFIETTPAGTRLFLVFAPLAPRSPATPAPSDAGSYAGLAPWRPPSYNEADVSDKPLWVRSLPVLIAAEQTGLDALRQRQLESLRAVDRAVGQIVDALARTGRLSSAAIVYTSDGSTSWGEHRWRITKQCPTPYEECIRIPLVVRAPGVVPRKDSSLVVNIDLGPTILSWAGNALAGIRPAGEPLTGLLSNPLGNWRPGAMLMLIGQPDDPSYGRPRYYGIRSERYKYLEYASGEFELYDLGVDPYELTNIYGRPEYAQVTSELKLILQFLRRR